MGDRRMTVDAGDRMMTAGAGDMRVTGGIQEDDSRCR